MEEGNKKNGFFSILLFLQPDLVIRVWPWKLTPLTARVIGGLFALTGVGDETAKLV